MKKPMVNTILVFAETFFFPLHNAKKICAPNSLGYKKHRNYVCLYNAKLKYLYRLVGQNCLSLRIQLL